MVKIAFNSALAQKALGKEVLVNDKVSIACFFVRNETEVARRYPVLALHALTNANVSEVSRLAS